jgi:hypothetical protein
LSWTLYPAFLATLISIFCLSRLAQNEYNRTIPQTLSELAAAEQSLLVRFRNILFVCGVLFAITVFGFIAVRAEQTGWIIVFGSLMVGGELLASLVPARDRLVTTHNVLAHIMAIGMLGLAVAFTIVLTGIFAVAEIVFVGLMGMFGVLSILDKRRYIVYELAFIFSSHVSILIAAIALA